MGCVNPNVFYRALLAVDFEKCKAPGLLYANRTAWCNEVGEAPVKPLVSLILVSPCDAIFDAVLYLPNMTVVARMLADDARCPLLHRGFGTSWLRYLLKYEERDGAASPRNESKRVRNANNG